MKKFVSMLLLLTLVMGLFAGCELGDKNPTTVPAPQGNGLADAAAYLAAMYKENDGTTVRKDFTRVSVVMIDGVKYEITWTVDSTEVTISEPANSMVTIDINEEPAEDVTFILTATLKDAEGKTESVTFTHYIEAPEASGTVFVKQPEAGVAYKFAMQQNELGKVLYFNGEMSGYYLATSENAYDGVDVFVEDVEGGQRMYFMKGDVKTYIDVVLREGYTDKCNVIMTEAPTCVYNWDAERGTFVVTLGENKFYIGTYGTYNTFSVSLFKYIEDTTKVGTSQFPGGLCTVTIAVTFAKTPVVGTAYKFAMQQNELGQTLYFTGEMSGYYLATSANPGQGVDVFVEDVEGGQRMYFMKGDVKTYIDVVLREGYTDKCNVIMTEAPTCVYNWDAERGTFVVTLGENKFYIGTYGTYNTFSVSLFKYIEDTTKVGTSQFPGGLATVG